MSSSVSFPPPDVPPGFPADEALAVTAAERGRTLALSSRNSRTTASASVNPEQFRVSWTLSALPADSVTGRRAASAILPRRYTAAHTLADRLPAEVLLTEAETVMVPSA